MVLFIITSNTFSTDCVADDDEQYHRWVRSILVLSIRSLLLTPAVAEPLDRSVRSLSVSVRSSVRSPLWARFFTILRMAWFLSSCLDFAWYLGSSLVLLGSCLWCWSLDHHVAFIQVTSCTLLNYKTITCKFISPIWLCWSSNTKIQSKWAKGPFSLQSPPFGDWWQHDQSKQIIKNCNLKSIYLLGCNARGKVIWC